MITNLTVKDLEDFENSIAEDFRERRIRAPVHLTSGCAAQFIEIFKLIKEEDYVVGTWRSHYNCLLKSVPPDKLRQAIYSKQSIHLNFPEYRVISTGIVGGCFPIAVGLGLAAKLKKESYKVFCISGDMSFNSGIANESIRYAISHDLPITWICADNNLSVYTNTRKVWNNSRLWFETFDHRQYFDHNIIYYPLWKIFHFHYESHWPHVNLPERIEF